MTIWRELNIKRTRDRIAIARAYAARLAEVDPGADPGRAEALCAAYRRAHRFCDAMESGPVARIGPRGPTAVKRRGARHNPVRPCRACPPRLSDAARAPDALSGNIAAALRGGDQRAAIAAMRALFRDPLFGNPRLRRAVESRILEAVDAQREFPVEFGLAALAAFRWDRDARNLSAPALAVAERLCAIAEGERRVAGLRRVARHWAIRMWFDRRAVAAALLTGRYRPRLFRLALLDPLTARAVRRLLHELRAHGGAAATRNLDSGVIAWWDSSLGAAEAAPTRPGRAA